MNNKFIILLCAAGVLAIVGALSYWSFHSPPPAASPTVTQVRALPATLPPPTPPSSTIQTAPSTSTPTTATPPPIRSWLWIGSKNKWIEAGDYTFDGFTLTGIPVYPGSWNNLEFSLQSNVLTVTRSGVKLYELGKIFSSDAVVNGERKGIREMFTFGYQDRQYFLLEGSGCYNLYCDYEFALYRLDKGNVFSRVGPASSLLATDEIPTMEGVIAAAGKLYVIIGYGNGHHAIVLDANGNLLTGEPNPPLIEEILRAPR